MAENAPGAGTTAARIRVNVFDGRRRPMDPAVRLFIRILDGAQKEIHAAEHEAPTVEFTVPFNDNFADRYTVLVSAKDYRQAGFTPVGARKGALRSLDLMLIPSVHRFEFLPWSELPESFCSVLAAGVSVSDATRRYERLALDGPLALAAVLNILTALGAIDLAHHTPLQYLKELVWDESMAQDRFFAYADEQLLEEVVTAAESGLFIPEPHPSMFHPGATRSYKQVEFGEANVQITFHEGDAKPIDGVRCLRVESDIDYYRSPSSHAVLEVVPNMVSKHRTDPATVYVLRWIAGRFAGVPEFEPPLRIVQNSV